MSDYIDLKENFGDFDNSTEENIDEFFQHCIIQAAVPEEDIEKAMDKFNVKTDWFKYYHMKIMFPYLFMPNYFIKNELDKIYNLITGRNRLIADDIADDNGKISEEKLDKLTAEIIDTYRFVKEACYYNGGPKIKIKQDEDEFYDDEMSDGSGNFFFKILLLIFGLALVVVVAIYLLNYFNRV